LVTDMAHLPLKPQYGPTLGQLLSPRWRALSLTGRSLLVGAVLVVVAAVAYVVLHAQPADYSHRGTVSFSFDYKGLKRTAAPPGTYVRAASSQRGRLNASVAFAPLTLPAYEGVASGYLPLYSAGVIAALNKRYEDFDFQGEGKTKVNDIPAYGIEYTVKVDGRVMDGRTVLVLDNQTNGRRGVSVALLSTFNPDVDAGTPLGSAGTGVTHLPLLTFRFQD
jgi:hypothetical protein